MTGRRSGHRAARAWSECPALATGHVAKPVATRDTAPVFASPAHSPETWSEIRAQVTRGVAGQAAPAAGGRPLGWTGVHLSRRHARAPRVGQRACLSLLAAASTLPSFCVSLQTCGPSGRPAASLPRTCVLGPVPGRRPEVQAGLFHRRVGDIADWATTPFPSGGRWRERGKAGRQPPAGGHGAAATLAWSLQAPSALSRE